MRAFLFFLLAAQAAFAQSWSPLYPADRCNFRHSDSTRITQVILTDSVRLDSNGIVWHYLNRVVADCDTCTSIWARLANQGQFLQKTMIARPDGRVDFWGRHPFCLFPAAPPGTEWLFDTLQNRTAIVTAVAAGLVLGEPDSLKTIVFSDGSAMVLSRHHGIVAFPDRQGGGQFNLAGIPNRSLGEAEPGWMDFFDFEPGDIFEHTEYNSLEPGTPASFNKVTKAVILSRHWDTDTLVYDVDERGKSWQQWSGPPFPYYWHDTVRWKVHPALAEPWVPEYPGKYMPLPLAPNGPSATRVSLADHPVYGRCKMLGAFSFPIQSVCAVFWAPQTPGSELLLCDGCVSYHHAYAVGLGFVSSDFSCFEFWNTNQLTGFVKNGDTTGILTPDIQLTVGQRPEPQPLPFTVAPNPAGADWTLFFPEPLPEPLQYTVFDIQGKRQQQGTIPAGVSQFVLLATNTLPGAYVLKVSSPTAAAQFKLWKQR